MSPDTIAAFLLGGAVLALAVSAVSFWRAYRPRRSRTVLRSAMGQTATVISSVPVRTPAEIFAELEYLRSIREQYKAEEAFFETSWGEDGRIQ